MLPYKNTPKDLSTTIYTHNLQEIISL